MSENFLLKAVIECHLDGILMVDALGHIIIANESARRICQRLAPEGFPDSQLPLPLWNLCRVMLQNRENLSDPSIMIEDQLALEPAGYVRVRVQWVQPQYPDVRLMVTLEDTFSAAQRRAELERRKYGLTDREAQVWLLRQADCTYKAIATKLHIEVNTVKKHLKSIYAKRDMVQWAEE